MEVSEKQDLLAALQRGSVTVSFRKIDTDELRVMPCTLNETVLIAEGVKAKVEMSQTSADSAHFAVWALDKNAWRSFRLETVEGWEVLGE